MAFDISFPFICRENSRRLGIPLFPTILRTQRFRLSRSSRMVGDKSGKLGMILSNNFPEAPQISAMISDHSWNYYVGYRGHSLAGCQPSNKRISAYKSKSIALSTTDVTNFWSLLWLRGKVTFGNKFSSSLNMFIVKGNKIRLGFDNKYPENNQRLPRQR